MGFLDELKKNAQKQYDNKTSKGFSSQNRKSDGQTKRSLPFANINRGFNYANVRGKKGISAAEPTKPWYVTQFERTDRTKRTVTNNRGKTTPVGNLRFNRPAEIKYAEPEPYERPEGSIKKYVQDALSLNFWDVPDSQGDMFQVGTDLFYQFTSGNFTGDWTLVCKYLKDNNYMAKDGSIKKDADLSGVFSATGLSYYQVIKAFEDIEAWQEELDSYLTPIYDDKGNIVDNDVSMDIVNLVSDKTNVEGKTFREVLNENGFENYTEKEFIKLMVSYNTVSRENQQIILETTAGLDPNATDSYLDVARVGIKKGGSEERPETRYTTNTRGKRIKVGGVVQADRALFSAFKDYFVNYKWKPLVQGRYGTVLMNTLVDLGETLDFLGIGARALVYDRPYIWYTGTEKGRHGSFNKSYEGQKAWVYSGGKENQKELILNGGLDLLAIDTNKRKNTSNLGIQEALTDDDERKKLLDALEEAGITEEEYEKFKKEYLEYFEGIDGKYNKKETDRSTSGYKKDKDYKNVSERFKEAYTDPTKNYILSSGSFGKDMFGYLVLDPTIWTSIVSQTMKASAKVAIQEVVVNCVKPYLDLNNVAPIKEKILFGRLMREVDSDTLFARITKSDLSSVSNDLLSSNPATIEKVVGTLINDLEKGGFFNKKAMTPYYTSAFVQGPRTVNGIGPKAVLVNPKELLKSKVTQALLTTQDSKLLKVIRGITCLDNSINVVYGALLKAVFLPPYASVKGVLCLKELGGFKNIPSRFKALCDVEKAEAMKVRQIVSGMDKSKDCGLGKMNEVFKTLGNAQILRTATPAHIEQLYDAFRAAQREDIVILTKLRKDLLNPNSSVVFVKADEGVRALVNRALKRLGGGTYSSIAELEKFLLTVEQRFANTGFDMPLVETLLKEYEDVIKEIKVAMYLTSDFEMLKIYRTLYEVDGEQGFINFVNELCGSMKSEGSFGSYKNPEKIESSIQECAELSPETKQYPASNLIPTSVEDIGDFLVSSGILFDLFRKFFKKIESVTASGDPEILNFFERLYQKLADKDPHAFKVKDGNQEDVVKVVECNLKESKAFTEVQIKGFDYLYDLVNKLFDEDTSPTLLSLKQSLINNDMQGLKDCMTLLEFRARLSGWDELEKINSWDDFLKSRFSYNSSKTVVQLLKDYKPDFMPLRHAYAQKAAKMYRQFKYNKLRKENDLSLLIKEFGDLDFVMSFEEGLINKTPEEALLEIREEKELVEMSAEEEALFHQEFIEWFQEYNEYRVYYNLKAFFKLFEGTVTLSDELLSVLKTQYIFKNEISKNKEASVRFVESILKANAATSPIEARVLKTISNSKAKQDVFALQRAFKKEFLEAYKDGREAFIEVSSRPRAIRGFKDILEWAGISRATYYAQLPKHIEDLEVLRDADDILLPRVQKDLELLDAGAKFKDLSSDTRFTLSVANISDEASCRAFLEDMVDGAEKRILFYDNLIYYLYQLRDGTKDVSSLWESILSLENFEVFGDAVVMWDNRGRSYYKTRDDLYPGTIFDEHKDYHLGFDLVETFKELKDIAERIEAGDVLAKLDYMRFLDRYKSFKPLDEVSSVNLEEKHQKIGDIENQLVDYGNKLSTNSTKKGSALSLLRTIIEDNILLKDINDVLDSEGLSILFKAEELGSCFHSALDDFNNTTFVDYRDFKDFMEVHFSDYFYRRTPDDSKFKNAYVRLLAAGYASKQKGKKLKLMPLSLSDFRKIILEEFKGEWSVAPLNINDITKFIKEGLPSAQRADKVYFENLLKERAKEQGRIDSRHNSKAKKKYYKDPDAGYTDPFSLPYYIQHFIPSSSGPATAVPKKVTVSLERSKTEYSFLSLDAKLQSFKFNRQGVNSSKHGFFYAVQTQVHLFIEGKITFDEMLDFLKRNYKALEAPEITKPTSPKQQLSSVFGVSIKDDFAVKKALRDILELINSSETTISTVYDLSYYLKTGAKAQATGIANEKQLFELKLDELNPLTLFNRLKRCHGSLMFISLHRNNELSKAELELMKKINVLKNFINNKYLTCSYNDDISLFDVFESPNSLISRTFSNTVISNFILDFDNTKSSLGELVMLFKDFSRTYNLDSVQSVVDYIEGYDKELFNTLLSLFKDIRMKDFQPFEDRIKGNPTGFRGSFYQTLEAFDISLGGIDTRFYDSSVTINDVLLSFRNEYPGLWKEFEKIQSLTGSSSIVQAFDWVLFLSDPNIQSIRKTLVDLSEKITNYKECVRIIENIDSDVMQFSKAERNALKEALFSAHPVLGVYSVPSADSFAENILNKAQSLMYEDHGGSLYSLSGLKKRYAFSDNFTFKNAVDPLLDNDYESPKALLAFGMLEDPNCFNSLFANTVDRPVYVVSYIKDLNDNITGAKVLKLFEVNKKQGVYDVVDIIQNSEYTVIHGDEEKIFDTFKDSVATHNKQYEGVNTDRRPIFLTFNVSDNVFLGNVRKSGFTLDEGNLFSIKHENILDYLKAIKNDSLISSETRERMKNIIMPYCRLNTASSFPHNAVRPTEVANDLKRVIDNLLNLDNSYGTGFKKANNPELNLEVLRENWFVDSIGGYGTKPYGIDEHGARVYHNNVSVWQPSRGLLNDESTPIIGELYRNIQKCFNANAEEFLKYSDAVKDLNTTSQEVTQRAVLNPSFESFEHWKKAYKGSFPDILVKRFFSSEDVSFCFNVRVGEDISYEAMTYMQRFAKDVAHISKFEVKSSVILEKYANDFKEFIRIFRDDYIIPKCTKYNELYCLKYLSIPQDTTEAYVVCQKLWNLYCEVNKAKAVEDYGKGLKRLEDLTDEELFWGNVFNNTELGNLRSSVSDGAKRLLDNENDAYFPMIYQPTNYASSVEYYKDRFVYAEKNQDRLNQTIEDHKMFLETSTMSYFSNVADAQTLAVSNLYTASEGLQRRLASMSEDELNLFHTEELAEHNRMRIVFTEQALKICSQGPKALISYMAHYAPVLVIAKYGFGLDKYMSSFRQVLSKVTNGMLIVRETDTHLLVKFDYDNVSLSYKNRSRYAEERSSCEVVFKGKVKYTVAPPLLRRIGLNPKNFSNGMGKELKKLQYQQRFITEGHEAGSIGEVLTYQKQKALFDVLKEEFPDVDFSKDVLLLDDFWHGCNFNRGLLGDSENVLRISKFDEDGLCKMYEESLAVISTRVKKVRLYLNSFFSGDCYLSCHKVFNNYKAEDIIQALKGHSEYVVCYLKEGKTECGFEVKQMHINTEADVTLAQARGAIIVPFDVYSTLYETINKFNFGVHFLDVWCKIMNAWKATMLSTLGATIRNTIEAAVKAVGDTGEPLVLVDNILRATQLYHDYSKIRNILYKDYSRYTKAEIVWLWDSIPNNTMSYYDYVFMDGWIRKSISSGQARVSQGYKYLEKKAISKNWGTRKGDSSTKEGRKAIKEGYDTLGPHSFRFENIDYDEIENLVMNMDYDSRFQIFEQNSMSQQRFLELFKDKYNATSEELARYEVIVNELIWYRAELVKGHVKLGAVTSKLNEFLFLVNSNIEERIRLGEYLTLVNNQGFSNTLAHKRITDTHFDYGLKSRQAHYLELLIPFYTYEMSSAIYLCKLVEENPRLLYYIERVWGTMTWNNTDYTKEERFLDGYINSTMMAGSVESLIFDGLNIKLNPFFMNTLNLMHGQGLLAKLTPALQLPLKYMMSAQGEEAYHLFDAYEIQPHFNSFGKDVLSQIPYLGKLFSMGFYYTDKHPWTYMAEEYKGGLSEVLLKGFPSFYKLRNYEFNQESDPKWDDYSWDKKCKIMLRKYGKVWDNNQQKFVLKEDYVPGLLNNPTLGWDERWEMSEKLLGITWDYNLGKPVRVEDKTIGGLNRDNLEWDEFALLTFALKGQVWTGNEFKQVCDPIVGYYKDLEDDKVKGKAKEEQDKIKDKLLGFIADPVYAAEPKTASKLKYKYLLTDSNRHNTHVFKIIENDPELKAQMEALYAKYGQSKWYNNTRYKGGWGYRNSSYLPSARTMRNKIYGGKSHIGSGNKVYTDVAKGFRTYNGYYNDKRVYDRFTYSGNKYPVTSKAIHTYDRRLNRANYYKKSFNSHSTRGMTSEQRLKRIKFAQWL